MYGALYAVDTFIDKFPGIARLCLLEVDTYTGWVKTVSYCTVISKARQ